MVRRVEDLCALHGAEPPVIRRTPTHCIVQFGPVAVTLAWLRSTIDSAADGELLVIVWRGDVAPRLTHRPERSVRDSRTAAPAAVVWEDSLVATGADEATWRWEPTHAMGTRYSSSQLAERCVDRLRRAHGRCGSHA